ncbi:MAG: universal stress protein [Candidatus Nitrosocosmicus sp.]|nr:universal stress protein [Candidatus Nitrosocosmicus sp.]
MILLFQSCYFPALLLLMIFDDYQELAEKESTEIKTELIFGEPGKVIIELSIKEKFDIIVIGNRGMGHLKEMIIGSVSVEVVHDTKSPVLLVK